MPVAWAIGGAAVLGYLGSRGQQQAAESAAQTQYQGTQEAARQQREMFDILNAQQKPYREAGYGALTKINEMLPQFTRQFTPADLQANLAPNYEFMKQQGLGQRHKVQTLQALVQTLIWQKPSLRKIMPKADTKTH